LQKSLAESFGVPVLVENDCNLAALAEAHACGLGSEDTLFYVTVGTGIGGGLVRNAKLQQLSDLGEAEIGHMVIEPEGPRCPCGNRGCLETLCSGPGLSKLAAQMTGQPIDAPTLMKAFRRGDEEATRVVRRAAEYLGRTIAAAATLLAPTFVVLGGGVMRDNKAFLDLIEAEAKPALFPPFRDRGIQFQLSRLWEDVVCQGAAILALQRLHALEVASDI
jgi:glucokinase